MHPQERSTVTRGRIKVEGESILLMLTQKSSPEEKSHVLVCVGRAVRMDVPQKWQSQNEDGNRSPHLIRNGQPVFFLFSPNGYQAVHESYTNKLKGNKKRQPPVHHTLETQNNNRISKLL